MSKSILLIALVSLMLTVSLQNEVKKTRVLVLLDNLIIKDTHSTFFSDLESNGYELDIKMINSHNYKLKEYGEYLYDQLILFASSEPDPRFIKLNQILEFYDSGHNILFAADVDTSKFFRQLANNFGVEFDQIGSKVYDYINSVDELDGSLFGTTNQIPQDVIASQVDGPILFRGIAQKHTIYENFQLWPILRGTEWTHSRRTDLGQDSVTSTATATILVSAAQGRNNARIIISGSLDLFSDELFTKSKGVNRKYTQELVAWNFGELGILKVDRIFHHKTGDNSYQPSEYKIKDDIVYTIDISTWDPKSSKWISFETDDLTLEFVMLDPYIRMPLTFNESTSQYVAEFKLPDKHGVFQFKVIYRKPGFTFLEAATKIPVRPFKHNEYERYLFDAFPYYVSVFGTLVGFYVFLIYFLYDSPKK